MKIMLLLLVALTLAGCGLDANRVRPVYVIDTNPYQAPQFVLPPSQCYGCGRR